MEISDEIKGSVSDEGWIGTYGIEWNGAAGSGPKSCTFHKTEINKMLAKWYHLQTCPCIVNIVVLKQLIYSIVSFYSFLVVNGYGYFCIYYLD